MPIAFDCACGKTLRAPDDAAGKRVKCPACSAVLLLPAPEPKFEVVSDPEPKFEVVSHLEKPGARAETDERADDVPDEWPRRKRSKYQGDDERRLRRSRHRKRGPGVREVWVTTKRVISGVLGCIALIGAVALGADALKGGEFIIFVRSGGMFLFSICCFTFSFTGWFPGDS